MANPAPLSVPHAATRDFYFQGFLIPKGTMLVPVTSSYTADPDMFPDPDVFNPSRFIDDSGNLKGQEKILAFSLGRYMSFDVINANKAQ